MLSSCLGTQFLKVLLWWSFRYYTKFSFSWITGQKLFFIYTRQSCLSAGSNFQSTGLMEKIVFIYTVQNFLSAGPNFILAVLLDLIVVHYKNNSRLDCRNYCPINLLSISTRKRNHCTSNCIRTNH